MTRLQAEDIADIAAELAAYDAELRVKTGCTLSTIACRAVGIAPEKIQGVTASRRVAVVPMTCGQGAIDGFAGAVKAIVSHIGFKAFVTRQTDAAGLAEAFEKKSDVVMLADDHRFVALNLNGRQMVDNAEATAKGFVTGLNLMAGGLKGRQVLVIGCGPVGRSAIAALLKREAEVSVYDVNQRRCQDLAAEIENVSRTEIRVEKALNRALMGHQLLIDATPAARIIDQQHITPQTYIAAPGMPHGLTPAALDRISGRCLHDPLPIGVATMIVDAGSQ